MASRQFYQLPRIIIFHGHIYLGIVSKNVINIVFWQLGRYKSIIENSILGRLLFLGLKAAAKATLKKLTVEVSRTREAMRT